MNSILGKYDCSAAVRHTKIAVEWKRSDLVDAWDETVLFLVSYPKKDLLSTRISEAYFARRPFPGFSKALFAMPVKVGNEVRAELHIADGKDGFYGFALYGRIPPKRGKPEIFEFNVLEPFVRTLWETFPNGCAFRKFLKSGIGNADFRDPGRPEKDFRTTASFDGTTWNLRLSFRVLPRLPGWEWSEETFFEKIGTIPK